MTERVAQIAALVSMAIPLAVAVAQTLSPTPVFEGRTTTLTKSGAMQPVGINVQSWEMSGPKDVTHDIPLRGFYLAHLLSGEISTTIGGQTTKQEAGAYWTVAPGGTMQVRVLHQFAVLETIVVSNR
jgi:hypothetical protein